MRGPAILAALLLAMAGLSSAALAATTATVPGSGQVTITGDSFIVDDPHHQATFTGNVVAKNADITLTSDKVVAFYKGQAARAGVQIGMDLSTPDSAMIGGNKDGLDFSLTAGPKDGGGTTANLSLKTKG